MSWCSEVAQAIVRRNTIMEQQVIRKMTLVQKVALIHITTHGSASNDGHVDGVKGKIDIRTLLKLVSWGYVDGMGGRLHPTPAAFEAAEILKVNPLRDRK